MCSFRQGSFTFRYLGIPLAAARLRESDYSVLVNANSKKITAWPRHTLSYAGKLELILSMVQGMKCYWLSVLPITCGVIGKINSVCRRFMWTSKNPPIAWSKICSPIEDGGLGIRDLRAWNKALLTKILWNIHIKKDTLWVRWVHHYYWNDVIDWRWRKDDIVLIKKLVEIRDELLAREGCWDTVVARLSIWFGTTKGFSEAYRSFLPGAGRWPWKPFLWRPHILPKHCFVLWIFVHEKCLTKDRQPYILDKSCGLCGTVNEIAQHVFFECTASTQLWVRLWQWLEVQCMVRSMTGLLRLLRRRFRGTTMRARRCHSGIAGLVYHIWSARNMALFDGERPDVEAIFRKILIHVHRTLAAG
ncbi:uncharacterized protein [Primulina eburnea]|uniref:uncharacterized protein n=1 Tax=Primulina eburnea TaxID=1245227 RepID=UPI003C6CB659